MQSSLSLLSVISQKRMWLTFMHLIEFKEAMNSPDSHSALLGFVMVNLYIIFSTSVIPSSANFIILRNWFVWRGGQPGFWEFRGGLEDLKTLKTRDLLNVCSRHPFSVSWNNDVAFRLGELVDAQLHLHPVTVAVFWIEDKLSMKFKKRWTTERRVRSVYNFWQLIFVYNLMNLLFDLLTEAVLSRFQT